MTNSKSNIFCPNCGANNKIEQNFCRFCSLNLQEAEKSLTAQLSSGKNARQLKKLELIKKISDFTSIGFGILIAVAILVYVYAILTETAFPGGKVLIGLVLGFIIVESALSYVRRKNTVGYWEEITKINSLTQNEFKNLETAKLLEEKPFEPAVTVAEDSTKFLFVENKTKKLE